MGVFGLCIRLPVDIKRLTTLPANLGETQLYSVSVMQHGCLRLFLNMCRKNSN